jgi:hypothetical protein
VRPYRRHHLGSLFAVHRRSRRSRSSYQYQSPWAAPHIGYRDFLCLATFSQRPSIAALIISYCDFDRWLKWTGRTNVIADFNTYKNSFPHARLSRAPEAVLEEVLRL